MGYITLFSDFGLQDASVAVAKGILMQHVPLHTIIDINHEVQPFNMMQAAYLFGSAYKNFPKGTCHVLMFDIFSAQNPRLILSEYDGHYFLSPDNDLLPLSIKDNVVNSWLCLELHRSHSFHTWLHRAGEIVGQLQNRTAAQLDLIGYELSSRIKNATSENETSYDVIHIDQFENVTVNFTRDQYEQLSPGKNFSIRFTKVEEINEIKDNYNDVKEGYKLCRFNSNGYLEICLNHGKAASLFGLKLGGKNNNIKIIFT